MSNSAFFAFSSTRQRMYAGPLGRFVDSYIGSLQELGYAKHSIRCKVRVIADFSRWLERRGLTPRDIDEDRAKRFLSQRLRSSRSTFSDHAALKQLMELLRGRSIIAGLVTPLPRSGRERVEQTFRSYLHDTRGLSLYTQVCYGRWVSRFLRHRFGSRPVRLRSLTSRDVTGFIQSCARKGGYSYAQQAVTALHAFLIFLHHRGLTSDDLSVCVPKLARWSLAHLPAFLRPKQVKRVLDRCERRTPIGRRDYVILLLLARLGLRAGEIAALTFEDVEWQNGALTIRSKGGQWTQVPLTQEIGAAIADYLTQRSVHIDRKLFGREKAPYRGFRGSTSISVLASRAMVRSGIDHPRGAAHLFRHALATDMLRHGASLAQIGQLLRHKHPDTTRIYAKVDVPALRRLAMPWPGGVS